MTFVGCIVDGIRLRHATDHAVDHVRSGGQAELESLGLAARSDVIDGVVSRMPKAYPIYDATYKGHISTVREFIDPIVNLHTVGRNGMHQYNNQDHSMRAAMLCVANMRGASHD